jgi:type III secretion protein C
MFVQRCRVAIKRLDGGSCCPGTSVVEPIESHMALRWFSRIEIAPLAIAIAIAAIGVGPASATEPKWASKNFVYRAENKRLPDVIQDFASSQGLAVITDAALEGTVNVSFNRSPSEFMSTLSKSYGVIWYFDGVSLFAYPARAMQSKVFRLRGFKREQVRQMLESLGLGDSRYPLRYNDAEQTLVAYGPPRHIELVSTVVSTLDQRYGNGGASEVVVVPLKFAFAADRGVGAARVKGLVSTLNSIYGGGGGAGGGGAGSGMAAEAGVVTQARQSAEANLGVPLTPQRRALEGQGQRASASSSGQPPASSAKGRQGIDVSERGAEAPESAAPLFQADEATNSVLVRAPVDQMPKYTALIRKLDVAQDLVEIEVTIIDVSSDDFDALGVDWNFELLLGRLFDHLCNRRQHHHPDCRRGPGFDDPGACTRKQRQSARDVTRPFARCGQPHREHVRQALGFGSCGGQPRSQSLHRRGRYFPAGLAANRAPCRHA